MTRGIYPPIRKRRKKKPADDSVRVINMQVRRGQDKERSASKIELRFLNGVLQSRTGRKEWEDVPSIIRPK